MADTFALLGDWEYGVLAPREALPQAKAAAVKALQLDNTFGEAHTSLAFCLDVFDWDLASADREFRRAIELNPGYATAHHWYAWHLSLLGRNDDAIAEMKKAQDLDPVSLIINADLAELLLIAHFTDESIEQSRKTIEMDASFPLAHNQLAVAYLQRNRIDEAVSELQHAVQLSAGSPTCTANLARAFAVSGRRTKAIQLLGDLKRRSACQLLERLGDRRGLCGARRQRSSNDLAREGVRGAVQSQCPPAAGVRSAPRRRAISGS